MNGLSLVNPLVSVVVPVWNVEVYLPFCLQSIKQQTYENLDIILVDDGSTDSSNVICDNAAKEDKRIKVIHKQNEGLSSARNIGMKEAKGEWLIFIDSDDFVDKNMISILMNAVLTNNSDVASCRYQVTTSYEVRKKVNKDKQDKTIDGKEAVKELLSERKSSTSAWGKLARTNLWKQCPFPEGRKYEDLPVTWKLFANADAVTLVNRQLYFYVKRDKSITKTPSLQSAMDYALSIKQVYQEVSSKYEKQCMYRCICFRCCLECCRLLELVFRIKPKNKDEIRIINDLNKATIAFIKRNRFSAFKNKYATLIQRIRIFLFGSLFAGCLLHVIILLKK